MKKILFLILLLAQTSFAEQYKVCQCNFNSCTESRNPSCMKIIRCKKTTEGDYYQATSNHTALMVIDAHRYCSNPMAGLMREDE